MNRFHFACPGEIFFGRGCVNEHAEVFSRMGKRAYIVSSRFVNGLRNVALDDVKRALSGQSIEFVVDEDAQPDPPVESVVKIKERALEFKPDFLVAVGGGSAMDTVKALNVLLKYPDDDAYAVLFGDGPHVYAVGGPDEGALPFAAVATTAGTGADIAGIAVLTRNDVKTKFGTNRRSFADYVFVDSGYISGCPKWLNHAAALDALCHGIETYVSRGSRDDFMTNMLTETSLQLFAQIKQPLLADEMTAADYDLQTLHSMLQGIVIVNELTGVPHGLGYPLSYYYHVPHGIACAAFEGEYLRILSDRGRVNRVLEILDFADIDSFCEYIREMVSQHIDIKVTHEQIEQWTDDFCETQWRVDRHPEALDRDTVKSIYERALARFIQ